MKALVLVGALVSLGAAVAQEDRPSEAELFGTPQKTPDGGVYLGEADGGTPEVTSGGEEPESRPSEEELFGGPTEPTESPAQTAQERQAEARTDDERGLEEGIVDRFASGDYEEDTLDIGGLYYQRFTATNREGNGFSRTTLSAPTLVDAYFDARPNDRLRAFLAARLQFDPQMGESAIASQFLGEPPDNPSLSLDQMWLRFDIARTVFVTAGRQHVKWGAGRFWNPTDYLHPVPRDSLALFDVRVGTNMLKLHVPVESNGANFYAMAILDNAYGEVGTLRDIGGAARAEWVLGTAEIGVDAIVQNGISPRYGVDLSSALGPIDAYGELSLRTGPYYRWEQVDTPMGPTFEETRAGELAVLGTVGANWTFVYRENDTATVGVEYFYNESGYDDPSIYPALFLNGAFQPFYLGQHYAALYALLPAPGSWERTSFVLSNLGNLSDRSFVSRLDFTVRVLTHLTVEANASVYYGTPEGEFRLRVTVPPTVINGQPMPGFTVPAQRYSAGLGLRVDI